MVSLQLRIDTNAQYRFRGIIKYDSICQNFKGGWDVEGVKKVPTMPNSE